MTVQPPLTLLLNLESRPDRLAIARKRCAAAALDPTVHYAITPETLRSQGQTWDPGVTDGNASCTANHLEMMALVVESGCEWAMVLEDDVSFDPGFHTELERAISAMPTDWDFLQVGWLPMINEVTRVQEWRSTLAEWRPARSLAHRVRPSIAVTPEPVKPDLPQWGTHCYLVSGRLAARMVPLRGNHIFAPVDHLFRHFLGSATSATAPIRFFRTRHPLAGQDWDLGSDIDDERLNWARQNSHQRDASGRVLRAQDPT